MRRGVWCAGKMMCWSAGGKGRVEVSVSLLLLLSLLQ